MLQEDRFSDDVIKIFHNAKGSLRYKITEWTTHYETSHDIEQSKNHWQTAYHPTSFDQAAGEYEPIPEEDPSSYHGENQTNAKLDTAPAPPVHSPAQSKNSSNPTFIGKKPRKEYD